LGNVNFLGVFEIVYFFLFGEGCASCYTCVIATPKEKKGQIVILSNERENERELPIDVEKV
jgi:hypothetical protein